MAKLFVCGDVMNSLRSLDFVGNNLSEVIRSADYAVCNFEGPELKEGQTANCPHQKPGTAAYLKSVGFDLMLLANNHITELGAEGLQNSIDVISSAGADSMGAGLSWDQAYHPLVRVVDGMKFGFINICEAQEGYYYSKDQSFGYAWIGYDELFDDVKRLSSITDRVVVFVHAGLEHKPIPLPEFRSFYKKLCDNGANCVIGSHPHCAQGYEYYGNKLIAYSLGNFYFPRANNAWPEENKSYSVMLDFHDDGALTFTPIYHHLQEGKVQLAVNNTDKVDMDFLCKLLDDNYSEYADKMCVSAYKDLISHLLAAATCGEYEDVPTKTLIKNHIAYTLFRKKFVYSTKMERQKLMLHLLENEPYRYAIAHALRNLINQK